MQEDFLHYVWQHQYFDKADLRTTAGEAVTVLRPGFHNTDAGPDFLSARLQLGEVEWNGAVEIHLRASDWHRHQHQHDAKYDQVVLHVVLHADEPVRRTNGSAVPALVLDGRLAPELVGRYEALLAAPPEALPCAALLPQMPDIVRTMMVERTLLERVEQKAAVLTALHQHLGGDWEAAAYHALMGAFGFKKNTEPLQRLAKALPLAVLRRHRHDRRQLEALLFGQAGFLAESEEVAHDLFIADLRTEYQFLAHKYQLAPAALAAHDWNFLRLRPANFPLVRLAQLGGRAPRPPLPVRRPTHGPGCYHAGAVLRRAGIGLLAGALPAGAGGQGAGPGSGQRPIADYQRGSPPARGLRPPYRAARAGGAGRSLTDRAARRTQLPDGRLRAAAF